MIGPSFELATGLTKYSKNYRDENQTMFDTEMQLKKFCGVSSSAELHLQ